jgi:hypothetical protein
VEYIGPRTRSQGFLTPANVAGSCGTTRRHMGGRVNGSSRGTAGTAVYGEGLLKKVGDRNEPDPMKRLPGDPHGQPPSESSGKV